MEYPLPIHPVTGITALGFRVDGRPIWPIRGASEDGDAGGDAAADQGDDTTSEDGGDTSDGETDWEAKFEAQKKITRDLERRGKKDLAKIRDLEQRLANLESGKKDDQGQTAEQLREQIRQELQADTLKERVLDKIEAKARNFVDAEDAAAILLRLHGVDEFITDGKVDADAIADALSDLAEKKPHLVAAQGGKRFQGGADGGVRKEAPKRAESLEEAIRRRYTPSTSH